ncbi:MAG: hypothetical protein H6582_05650 [Crocinitomicaceae bacterium]|nr:hypothetical protein [Crocinitomicaceae bacterium]
MGIIGDVYDVEDFSELGYYIAVGDFSTVSGQSDVLHNIAFFGKNGYDMYYSASSANIITSIDGPIRTAKIHYYYGPPFFQHLYYLYIGGDFTMVNGQTRNGIARFYLNASISTDISTFALHGWDPQFSANPATVYDIEKRNDTLYVAGDFFDVNYGASYPYDLRPAKIAAFNASSGADLNMFHVGQVCNSTISSDVTRGIELAKHRILVSGEFSGMNPWDSFVRFDYTGCYDSDFSPAVSTQTGPGYSTGGYDVAISADTNYAGTYQYLALDGSLWSITDTTYYGPPLSLLPQTGTGGNGVAYTPPPPGSYIIDYTDVAGYKDQMFFARSLVYNGGGAAPAEFSNVFSYDEGGINWAAPNMTYDFLDIDYEHLFVNDNLLFVTAPVTFDLSFGGLGGGPSRTGIAIYCLEPDDAQNFTAFDTTVCQGDIVTYTIPAAKFADGYDWSFSGGGADLNMGQSGEQSTIDDTVTIDIEFLETFTGGVLTVTPYSTCNGHTMNSSKVYSDPISITIGLNPLPNAIAGADTVLNCYNNEQVTLNGYSDSVIVEYRWNQILNPFFPDSIGINYTAHDSDWYVLKVKAPNGCLNFDTVFVDMDTIKPTFNPIIPDILGCDDTIYVTGVPNNGIDTICWWNPFGTSDSIPNPLQCSDNGPYSIGSYDFYTKFIGNGCISYTSIIVEKNDTVADIQINGYASIPISGYLDVITCAIPSLNLQTYSNTTNSTVNWMDNDSTNPQGDTKLIAASGLYLIQSINNDNNCIDYAWLQIGVDSSFATLMIDQPITDLNCSNDSILLNGSTFTNDTTLIWTGTSISPSNNPLYVTSPGYYTFNVTKNSNGCTNKDSVLVVQNNSIDINTSNDTVGCNQDQIDVSASYVGNISGITYSWSNGATSASTSYTAGSDSLAIIEISGNGGCYGTDTVKISIPPLPAISVQGYAPCGTPNSGYLVVTPLSGWAPFEYSIDGGTTFQSSSTLAGLSSGNYTITMKDSLGCIYDFPATLSDDAAPPTPDFLLSTYNYESDTIAIVNVSNPMPDSVNWIFPTSFIIIDDNDTLPLVILPDTGEFVVTMEGYYGACIGSKTKVIHVTEFDTTVATLYNENGIKSVSLYPNPTNGNFTVEVELYKEQNIILNLSDMSGYVYEQVTEQNALIYSHDFQMDLNAQNGTYVIYIAAEFDSAYITFILNK